MHRRVMIVATLIAALLLLSACSEDTPTPDSVSTPTSPPTSVPTLTPTPTSAPAPTHVPGLPYLTEEIPPCTPLEGSSVDPCEPGVKIETSLLEGVGESLNRRVVPRTIREYLNGGAISFIPHIVVRGTYIPGTVRCTSGTPDRDPSYVDPVYIQRSLIFLCYADVQVNGYVLGSGPLRLTVLVHFLHYESEFFAKDPVMQDLFTTEEEREEWVRSTLESIFRGDSRSAAGISGREVVLFIGPPHSHSIEVWEVFETWDVQKREDGTVVAVHPRRDYWRDTRPTDYQAHRSKLEMELPAFTQAVTTAHQARVTEYGGRIASADIESKAEGVDLPMLVTDANQLRQFLTDTGAYNHPDGPPSQPPPPCGLVVPGEGHNPGLMMDCRALLAAKDALRGTAALNWSVITAITSWGGVTTSGTPSRVTKLLLPSKSLSGSIPSELGSLIKLTHLDLSSNSLTGEIPRELSGLSNLVEIRLSGNSLTGCIPSALKDVKTNDLSSLNMLYCPPPPENLSAGTPGEFSVPLSWDAVSNAAPYRVEHRMSGSDEWTVDDETLTGTSHTVDELRCETEHQFRVSAYGDGVVHAEEWSEHSAAVTAATTACVSPVFDAAPYTFHISEDAVVGAVVGSVSATDPQDDAITYNLTAGNEDGKFAIDGGTGRITVAGELDYETTTSYTLTVEADDGNGGTATVSVVITVTDVAEPTITITGLSNSIGLGESDEFTVTASTVNPSNVYIIQATTNNSNIGFTQSCATTSA